MIIMMKHITLSFLCILSLVTVLSTVAIADNKTTTIIAVPKKEAEKHHVETLQPDSEAPAPAPETIETEEEIGTYKLSSGDHLRIMVFGVDDLSGEYKVDPTGHITIPLIGQISAIGLDKKSLQNLIKYKLISGNYYKDPKVTVEIIALQPFYILGEVRNPGRYDYVDGLDIFKAIAIAGGYTPRASQDKVMIIRKVHGDKIEIKASEDTPVLPGDSIKVKQRFF